MPDADPLANLSLEEKQALADLAKANNQGRIDRRSLLEAGGIMGLGALVGGGGLYAATDGAEADAVAADVGTKADPWQKVYTHAIQAGDGTASLGFDDSVAFDHEAVSSATTIGNVTVVEYDSSVSGFTITIPASLEESGVVLRFVDAGDSAGSNNVDVTSTNWNIDGSGTTTIDASSTVFELHADGAEWKSAIFTDSVVAGTSVQTPRVDDGSGNTVLANRVASGSVTLSSGTATVDTGVSESTTATFFVALGPDTDDAEVAASIDANSGGNYEVHIDETQTNVGNPTIRYDIVRVR